MVWQILSKFFAFPNGIEQECAILAKTTDHVVHMQVSLYMASHKIRRLYLISGTDRRVAETKVRTSETTALLGIVREVRLTIFLGIVADNLDRVFVCTDSTISAKAVEFSFKDAFAAESLFFFERKRCKRNVINNTECKVVFRFGEIEIVVNRNNHSRCGIATSETVTASNDERLVLFSVESVANVKIKRFAFCSGLFGSVENGYTFNGRRYCFKEMLCRERTVQVYANHTYLLAICIEVVDCLAGSFGSRAHENNHTVCVFSAIVAEQFVFTSGDLRNFFHVFFHDTGNCIIVFVANLTVCEESFRILGHASCHWVFGRKCTRAEFCKSLLVYEGTQFVFAYFLDFLVFVGCAETVKEVNKRHTAFDCCKMGYSRQIHYFLYAAFAQHCETCLTARHYIAMIAKYTQGV